MFKLNNLFSPIFWFGDKEIKNSDPTFKDLILKNHEFEEIIGHPNFPDELAKQSDYLISYLADPEVLRKIISCINLSDFVEEYQTNLYSIISSRCSLVLARCNLKVTATLFATPHLEVEFFKMIKLKSSTHATSQGYFYDICRNLIEEGDIQKKILITIFENPEKRYIFNMIENLTFSNSLLLKLLMSDPNGISQERKNGVFGYLVYYFMNAKFLDNKKEFPDDFFFENVFEFISFLGTEKIKFEYKKKYILNLFNEKTIKNEEFFLKLFRLRVTLLTYIVESGQLNEFQNPVNFLVRIIDISNQYKKNIVLFEGLLFYKAISKNQAFLTCVNDDFIKTIISLIDRNSKSDVIHNLIFSILQNLIEFIIKSQNSLILAIDYLNQTILASNSQKISSPTLNNVSQHFLAKLVTGLLIKGISDSELKIKVIDLKGKLDMFYPHWMPKSLSVSSYSKFDTNTVLRTEKDVAKFIENLDREDPNIQENSFQISEEIFLSRSSIASLNTRKSLPVTQNDKAAYEVLQSLVNSQSCLEQDVDLKVKNDFEPEFENNIEKIIRKD